MSDDHSSGRDISPLAQQGAGYCAGIAAGLYPEDIAARLARSAYAPERDEAWIEKHYGGWKQAVSMLLG